MGKFVLLAVLLATTLCSGALGAHNTGDVWSQYSDYPNTLFLAFDILDNTTTSTAEECATKCMEYDRNGAVCIYWGWCPTNAETGLIQGCEYVAFGETVAAGWAAEETCLLSWNGDTKRTGLLALNGTDIAWESGIYDPRGGPAPVPSPEEPSPEPSNPPARSPSPSSPGSGGSCAGEQNTLYSAVSNTAELVDQVSNVATPEDCCGLCWQTEGCTAFFYCYADASSCNDWDNISLPGSLEPGTCFLWNIPDLQVQLVSDSPDTPWVSGYPTSD